MRRGSGVEDGECWGVDGVLSKCERREGGSSSSAVGRLGVEECSGTSGVSLRSGDCALSGTGSKSAALDSVESVCDGDLRTRSVLVKIVKQGIRTRGMR